MLLLDVPVFCCLTRHWQDWVRAENDVRRSPLRRLAQEGITIVIIEHTMHAMVRLCRLIPGP